MAEADSSHEIDIELGEPPGSSSEDDTASLLGSNGASRRMKVATAIIAVLCLVGVSVALTAHSAQQDAQTANAAQGDDISVSFGSLETTTEQSADRDDRDDSDDADDSQPFLSMEFSSDDSALFVLSKANWNASFIVYPTVAKHAAPVEFGLEHGSILLETNDFMFHFELSSDEKYLLLVQEYHYATLDGSGADELQQVFDDSQWPGYITKVPIYTETDDAYHIPSEDFLGNGFYVSSALESSGFNALKEPSEFFPRNARLFVEYELEIGVVVVSYSIGLLPEQIMAQRVADDRVGYFSKRYTHYGIGDQELNDGNGFHRWDPQTTVIHRHKLELDPATNATKSPITYYIDPSVPKRWREAFAAGVEAWSPAFEHIGFSNAIRAVLPGDPDWPADYRLGDLRYNSISVMISDRTYAYGPTIIDPRSGEILHGAIMFEYGFFNAAMKHFDVKSPADPPSSASKTANTGSLNAQTKPLSSHTGRNRQCGLAHNPQHQLDRMLLSTVAADDNGFVPERLVAQYFTQTIMHEVGHTLGLRHNFAGSAAYSREQLHDPAFVAEHGLSTSVMDYLPVNIFSDLKEAEVESHAFYMTTIGAYDHVAIAYGYSTVVDETPANKHPRLTELASSAPMFLTDESLDNMVNPFAQQFDLSSDPVDYANDYLEFVIQSRSSSAVLAKIPEDASWTTLWRRERAYLQMVVQAIKFVQPMLGGVNVTHAHRHKGEDRYRPEFVSRATQQRALAVLVRIIRAESGLFPEPEDYASYIEVVGTDDEDCNAPSLDYGCLGRGLVDVDAIVLAIREKAVHAALFPAIERIVQQDVSSPLTLEEVLETVANATALELQRPRNQAVDDFYRQTLVDIISDSDVDSRIEVAIRHMRRDIAPLPVVIAKKESHSHEFLNGTE
ncbi:hypothetical protein BBJ28_00009526 [Nothophytophthora sp. Chile5]|nr:hypothetical protein BBJ28_00009526 [Nothophytophthora sp. Chile5]